MSEYCPRCAAEYMGLGHFDLPHTCKGAREMSNTFKNLAGPGATEEDHLIFQQAGGLLAQHKRGKLAETELNAELLRLGDELSWNRATHTPTDHAHARHQRVADTEQ